MPPSAQAPRPVAQRAASAKRDRGNGQLPCLATHQRTGNPCRFRRNQRTRGRTERTRSRNPYSRDTGGASVQLVLAVPALMLCLLFVVQAAVWWHATHVAQSAATRAADTARVDRGSATAGEATGRDTVTALGDTVLRDPEVDVARSAAETRAEVRGVAMTVIPGIRWRVRATAVAPTERFTQPGAQPQAAGQ